MDRKLLAVQQEQEEENGGPNRNGRITDTAAGTGIPTDTQRCRKVCVCVFVTGHITASSNTYGMCSVAIPQKCAAGDEGTVIEVIVVVRPFE